MLQIENISFKYNAQNTIDSIGFELQKGENLAIIGESGCGKTTLLKLIYGLYDTNFGTIKWNDKLVLGPKFNLVPGHDKMKYLAQDYDLMPYVTVAENIGKFLSNATPDYKMARIYELLEMVELQDFENVKVQFLSGGQQQRVALARALAAEPELLLLDEPFTNIDSFRKGALRRNLFAYLKSRNIATIIASHDCTEALSFCDKTLVLKHGKVIQYDNSKIIYNKPCNKYVASMFGEVNELKANIFVQNQDTNKNILIYPNELYLTDVSNIKVVVKYSYFKGYNYLIKAVFGSKIVFFENPFSIPNNETVFLDVDNDVLSNRL